LAGAVKISATLQIESILNKFAEHATLAKLTDKGVLTLDYRITLLGTTILVLAGCQQQPEPAAINPLQGSPIAATVNGAPIYERDIDMKLAAMPESLQQFREDPQARSYILHTLIRRNLVSQKATALGLDLDPSIRQRINMARRDILIEAAKNWQISHMPKIPESAIQHYYDQHPDEFTVPEQIHARHILVATEKQARSILNKLKRKRATFSALAASESLDDSNKSRGGDLNWFSRGVMVQPFEQAAFALEPNTLSEPVKTKFGWHIIEVLGKRPASRKDLAEVRDEIQSQLQQAQMEEWFKQLEHTANIKLMPPYTSITPASNLGGDNTQAQTEK